MSTGLSTQSVVCDDTSRTPSAAVPVAQTNAAGKRRGKTFRNVLLGVLVGGTLLWIGRHPVLRGMASFLEAHDRKPSVQFLVLEAGGTQLQEVTAICQTNPECRILVFRQPRNRLIESGLVSPAEDWLKANLQKAGISETKFQMISGDCSTDWEHADRLAEVLQQHPQAHLQLMCGQRAGRQWQWIVRKTMPPSIADRVHVQSIPDKAAPRNWWQSKTSFLDVWQGYLGLVFVAVHGREHTRAQELSFEDYEDKLLRSARPVSVSAVNPGR